MSGFQWIIDHAENISMDRMKIVATTTARDGMTRSVSRGTPLWKFNVKLPDGIKWTQLRNYISNAEYLDKVQTDTIQFSDTGHEWIVKYQGNSSNPTGFTASWTKDSSTINIYGGGSISSGYKFKAGDFVQLGPTGRVYTIAQDVPYGATTAILHRPVLETTGSGALRVGQNCIWTVKCIDFPKWKLMAYDQTSWSGEFIFVEA